MVVDFLKQDRIQESYFLKMSITVPIQRALELRNWEHNPNISPEKTNPFKYENQNMIKIQYPQKTLKDQNRNERL